MHPAGLAVPDRQARLADPLPQAEKAEPELREEGPEERLAEKETAMEVHQVLHSLPEPYREVFALRVLGELSFREIGALFHKTESWARVTFHRARLKIKEAL